MDYIVKKLVAKQLKAKGNKRKPKKGGSAGAVQEPNNPLVGFGKKKKRGSAMKAVKIRGGALNPIRPMSIGNSISGTAF